MTEGIPTPAERVALARKLAPYLARLTGETAAGSLGETWEVVERCVPRFDPARGRFDRYAQAALRRYAMTILRRRSGRSTVRALQVPDGDDPAEPEPPEVPEVPDLSRLPAPMADVVSIRLRGTTYKGAAAALGLPLGTVKSRMHHAYRMLAATLACAAISCSAPSPAAPVGRADAQPGWIADSVRCDGRTVVWDGQRWTEPPRWARVTTPGYVPVWRGR